MPINPMRSAMMVCFLSCLCRLGPFRRGAPRVLPWLGVWQFREEMNSSPTEFRGVHLSPISPFLQPTQRFRGGGRWLVFEANPAVVADGVEVVEDVGIVQLAGAGLVAGRAIRDLD